MGNLMQNWGDEIQERVEKEVKENVKTCPKCGETENLGMERSPFGDSFCYSCGFKDKHATFYVGSPEHEVLMNDDVLYIDSYDKNKKIIDKGDYIIAKGGDGTLLKAINKFRHLNKPFFGVAAGTQNFLMNSENSISEDAKYKKFNLIKVKVTYKIQACKSEPWESEDIKEFQAFNEICFGGDMNSWINFNVHDKDAIIGQFKGGGVIISTAQGSTGINRNNSGAILPLSSDQWYITGDKTNRHISVPIEPKRTSITATSRQNIKVWVDGSNHIIENVSKIEISKGDEVTVIFNNYHEFKRKRRV
jgi:NAD+ kinase